MPPRGEAPAVREIEKLYLDMIAAARAHDLHREPVLHRAAHRRRAREAPRRARRPGDRAGAAPAQPRLARGAHHARAAHAPDPAPAAPPTATAASASTTRTCPGLAEGCCLDVHSKLMIVDDRDAAHRLGQPRATARWALDTECDVVDRGARRAAQVARGDHATSATGCSPSTSASRRRRCATEIARAGIAARRDRGAAAASARSLRELERPARNGPRRSSSWPRSPIPDEPIALDVPQHRAQRPRTTSSGQSRPAWGKLAADRRASSPACTAALALHAARRRRHRRERHRAGRKDFGARWWAPLAVDRSPTRRPASSCSRGR